MTITIAVDVMGSDRGSRPLLKGLDRALREDQDLEFLLFGQEIVLRPLLTRYQLLKKHARILDCQDVILMTDKPSSAMRNGKNSSMAKAIEAVKSGEAAVAISCGNTGALMALSMLILRKAPNVRRPAIAVLWPSRKADNGLNIMLDAGADVRADAEDLEQYAIMGASYARNAFDIEKPRIGLMNVGTEEGKGRPELSEAAERIAAIESIAEIEFQGFVESPALLSTDSDVIVTDGFTGNVTLKTGEAVARYMGDTIRSAFTKTIFSRAAMMLSITQLNAIRRKFDPRRSNGGVFLGLGGLVIKSHGSSDHVAMASAVRLADKLARKDFYNKMSKRLETSLALSKDINA